MKLRITLKLFLAILLTNVLIAVAYAVATQLSVDRGFREYVRDREQRRLQIVADDVRSAYLEHGNLDFLRGDDAQWRRITRPERILVRRLRNSGESPPRPIRESAIAGAQNPSQRGPPSEGVSPGVPDEAARAERPVLPLAAPPLGAGLFAGIDLTLLDTRGALLAGPALGRAGESLRQPVNVNGSTVAWVVAQGPALAGADTRFLQQQLQMSWIVAGLAILLAVLVAIPLARGFLSPIRKLARATHRLAAGNYAQRVEPHARDELGQLTQDFNELAGKLQSAEDARRAFLADISHELRTPLAVLKAELEALQDGVRSLTPDAIRSLQGEVQTLGALVDDLYDLAVADLGAATYHKEDIDLAELVRATLHAFAPRFAERRLAVDDSRIAAGPVNVHADARRLTQMINNLLENALRYTDAGGRVLVGVVAAGPDAALDVEDSEPGVAPEALPRLFERLFRIEASRNRELGGSGLGLSLCRSIVEAHDGQISAQASALGGVRIHVVLPLLRARTEAER
ncbi:MAG TPA: ATP-binding protein [Casimicrobiaceae bacterium]|nr:ATP-binding protein [Casimicrobiaceae bacterium]